MPEESLPRIGDRVTLTGSEDVFFVVDVNPGAQTASLLPTGEGRILDLVSWESLKFYRGLKV